MVRTAEHSGDNGVGVARTTNHLKKEQCQCSRGRCAHRQCRRARCLLTSKQAASPQASRCESRRGGLTFSAPAEQVVCLLGSGLARASSCPAARRGRTMTCDRVAIVLSFPTLPVCTFLFRP